MADIEFDIDAVANAVAGAVTQSLGRDIKTFESFSERQLKSLAKQARLIAQGYANGELTDDDVQYFLDNMEDMSKNFVKTLQGLTLISIENAWNAAVGVLHTSIKESLGAAGISIPNLD